MQVFQIVKAARYHFDIYRNVQERFAVPVHIGDKLCNVLKITFGGDRLLQVVGEASLHTVFVGGIGDYPFFLRCRNVPCVNAERNSVIFAQIAQDSLFACAFVVFAERLCLTQH